MKTRIILIVLDSVGIGALPDADEYGDQGADTLGNLAEAVGGLDLPHLQELGLGKIKNITGVDSDVVARGVFGKMAEASVGKDTTTGHWELAGIISEHPFPVYPRGFPPEVIQPFQKAISDKILGNKPASGTEIIEELGRKHLDTGQPIVYTSADSVFQIAAHVDIISVSELYEMCELAREILQGEHAVARVIARPFRGEPGNFERTKDRKDFSLEPPAKTMLDRLEEKGFEVAGVGKIEDIFSGHGLTESNPVKNNMAVVDAVLDYMEQMSAGLLWANLVEFDMKYGHRRDPEGYYRALKDFDQRLSEIMDNMNQEDLLFITADHGCDPTFRGTDHTREYVPLLIYGNRVAKNHNLGTRESFADLAATILEILTAEDTGEGKSFAADII